MSSYEDETLKMIINNFITDVKNLDEEKTEIEKIDDIHDAMVNFWTKNLSFFDKNKDKRSEFYHSYMLLRAKQISAGIMRYNGVKRLEKVNDKTLIKEWFKLYIDAMCDFNNDKKHKETPVEDHKTKETKAYQFIMNKLQEINEAKDTRENKKPITQTYLDEYVRTFKYQRYLTPKIYRRSNTYTIKKNEKAVELGFASLIEVDETLSFIVNRIISLDENIFAYRDDKFQGAKNSKIFSEFYDDPRFADIFKKDGIIKEMFELLM